MTPLIPPAKERSRVGKCLRHLCPDPNSRKCIFTPRSQPHVFVTRTASDEFVGLFVKPNGTLALQAQTHPARLDELPHIPPKWRFNDYEIAHCWSGEENRRQGYGSKKDRDKKPEFYLVCAASYREVPPGAPCGQVVRDVNDMLAEARKMANDVLHATHAEREVQAFREFRKNRRGNA